MEENILEGRPQSLKGTDTSSQLLSSPADTIAQVETEDEALIQQAGEVDEEADLILRAKQGDGEASNKLAQSTYPYILNYFRNKLRNKLFVKLSAQRVDEVAEVKTQDTYERAWKKLPDYQQQGKPFLAMLYGIARNIWYETLRELGKECTVDDLETYQELEAEHASCPEEVAIMLEKQEAFQHALDTLSPVERLIIDMRIKEKLSFREIAQSIKITENNAKNKFHRSKEKLKQLLLPIHTQGYGQFEQGKRPRLFRKKPHQAKHDKPT